MIACFADVLADQHSIGSPLSIYSFTITPFIRELNTLSDELGASSTTCLTFGSAISLNR